MNWNIIIILFIIIIKLYYSNPNNFTSIKHKVDNLSFYRDYNLQIFEECIQNTQYIDRLIISMKSKYTKERERKQKYDNVLEISNKCMNDFHSLIYSIPVEEKDIVKRFDNDLRIYKCFINLKIQKAKEIYLTMNKNDINRFTELVYDNNPLPRDISFNSNYNFY